MQQVELARRPLRIEEHRAYVYWCPRCQKFHYAPLPDEVKKGGLAGPRLTALVAYLKGGCHASYATIQAFLRDVVKVPLSTGQLARLIRKTGAALDAPYDELLRRLPLQEILNVDETGLAAGAENSLHWCLDMAFREDESRVRKENGPANLAILRCFALSLLKNKKTHQRGIQGKRLLAGWDNDYLLKVLGVSRS